MDAEPRIIAAVDFSPCSAAALRRAARAAEWKHGRLTVLHVLDVRPTLAADLFIPEILGFPATPDRDAMAETRSQWAGFARDCGVPPETAFSIEIGIPRDEIVAAAQRERPALLAIGAHGGDDGGRGMGTTASACVQWSPAPVLVVRPDGGGPFRSVAACVDFSETSRRALDEAVSLALEDAAALHVLHVYTSPWGKRQAPDQTRRNMPEFEVKYREAVEQRLREFCTPLAHELNACRAQFYALEAPGHAAGILRFVGERGCDLVVLGTRGRWNVRDMVWGSTAERVVREAKCSALVVQPARLADLPPAAAARSASAPTTQARYLTAL